MSRPRPKLCASARRQGLRPRPRLHPQASAQARTDRRPRRMLSAQRRFLGRPRGRRVAGSEAKERTPEKWLEDIRKLKTQGKTAEVERELAEFKKRYPDYRPPDDLR